MKNILLTLIGMGCITLIAATVINDRTVIVDALPILNNRLPDSIPVDVVSNHDGDTITVAHSGKRIKVRLCGIDAPELSQPLGRESKAYVSFLLSSGGGKAYLVEVERDRYDRVVGEIFIPQNNQEIHLNAAVVGQGLAYHYKQYSKNCFNRDAIESQEALALSKGIGVWAGQHTPPWEYRKRSK